MPTRLLSDQRGFTIVEVLVAAMILIVGVLGTVALVDNANSTTQRSMGREAGTNLARELIENARLVPYPNATADRLLTELQARPGLADADGAAGYQLRRRNRTFTVDSAICVLDDPKDGLGEHDSSFCGDSAPAGTADGNAKDYKRATFTLSWTQSGRQHQVRQATIIAPRGTADLPRVTNLEMATPVAATSTTTPPPVITTNVASARFRVRTSTVPSGVSWLIDGGVKGLALGGGLDWYFDWSLTGKADGTYQVGAQPFDSSGASGAASEMTVKLNRFLPGAPAPLYAGHNVIPSSGGTRKVDVEWKPNTDKDVLGYRVYWRYADAAGTPTGTGPTRACPGPGADPSYSTQTTCSWLDPASGGADKVKLNVWVVAVDKDGATETLREGTTSAVIDTFAADNPPNEPSSLNTQKPGDGTVVLTWNASSGDPDPGDGVLYYRIYRKAGNPPQICNGETPYDRTPFETGTEGPTRRWVDPNPINGTSTYAVCAVDRKMKQSVPPTMTTLSYP